MTRTQIQLPDPLYHQLKDIARQQDWSLAELMRRAGEDFAKRFQYNVSTNDSEEWVLPILDPRDMNTEALHERAEVTLLEERI